MGGSTERGYPTRARNPNPPPHAPTLAPRWAPPTNCQESWWTKTLGLDTLLKQLHACRPRQLRANVHTPCRHFKSSRHG